MKILKILGAVAAVAAIAGAAWAGCGGCGCKNKDPLAQAATQCKSFGAESSETLKALGCQVEKNLAKI
jgi:hypothetical protein